MIRFIFSTFSCLVLFSAPVFAGFEWIPPMNNPAPLPQATGPVESKMPDTDNTVGGGFPAPSVSSEPLANRPIRMPMSTAPVASKNKVRNLSGKKLVINPYPLRDNVPAPASVSMKEVYKAMNEESGKLHPVRLGNAMTTGAKRISEPVISSPVRVASATTDRPKAPTGMGITPMMGAEPVPLPGAGMPRSPVEGIGSSPKYVEAVGFGRDLPLALALSQVVPSEFTHSFGKDVDAGVTVSWEGGKPWNLVLNDMLSPKNLTAVIQGNQVIIQPSKKL